MIDRGGHVRVLPTTTAATRDDDSEQWVEEIAESEIPLSDYQLRLIKLRQAEDGFHEELAATASDGATPLE